MLEYDPNCFILLCKDSRRPYAIDVNPTLYPKETFLGCHMGVYEIGNHEPDMSSRTLGIQATMHTQPAHSLRVLAEASAGMETLERQHWPNLRQRCGREELTGLGF